MRLLPNPQHLFFRQSREAEHANLLRDVFPASRRLQLFQPALQLLAHFDDPTAHGGQIGFPFLKQGRVVEHETCDSGAIGGRIADFAALQNQELRPNAANGVCCVRGSAGDEMEGAGAFAVEAKVLGKGLRDAHFEALLDEVADGPGVAFEIAGCEALVGAIEEGEVLLGAHDLGDFFPLGAGWVDACGVVRAGVEEHDAAFGRIGHGCTHAIEVEAFGLGGEIGVAVQGEVDIGEDLVVVCPGRVGEVDGLVVASGVEFGKEEAAEMDGAGTGDSLQTDDLG